MKSLLFAFKYLSKLRGNNLIKVITLTLGLTLGWIFLTQIVFIRSFNNFIPDKENIYHISCIFNGSKNFQISGPITSALERELPEIIQSTTMHFGRPKTFVYNENIHTVEMLYADTSFFDMFGVTLLSGDDPKQALTDLNNIYLSESAARRIFGDEDPVGEIMTRQEVFFRVAGVFKDFPKNSHIEFDAVLGLDNAVRLDGSYYSWLGGDSYIGYIKLSPEADPKAVEAKLLDALQKHHDFKKDAARGYREEFVLDPLNDIYKNEPRTRDRQQMLLLLSFIVLAVSGMNYVLSSLSSLATRGRTMAMYKCTGAGRSDIFSIVVWETLLLLVAAVLFTLLLLGAFQNQITQMIGPTSAMLFSSYNILRVLPITVLLLLLTGLIPATIFSKIPVTVAYRGFLADKHLWKQTLLFIQFTGITLTLFLLTTVARQHRMMLYKDPGYNVERMVYTDIIRDMDVSAYRNTKAALLALPFVESVCTGMNPALGPGCGAGIQNVPNEPLLFTCDEDFIDEDFFPSMGIELKYGENFTPNAPRNTCIIDEELARRWGETGNPCGKTISCNHYSYTIVGVVKSFHSGSWRYTNRGKFFHPIQPDDEATDWASPYISIRLTELSPENIATLTQKLKELHPDKSCNLSFYDDLKHALYDEERKSRNMIFAGVVLTLMIAMMGLFGFINDEVRRRSKEIAIRKVNGATPNSIIRLITSDLKYTVLLSAVTGIALSVWLSRKWLEQFPVRISIDVWQVLGCGIAVIVLIYGITVLKIWRTANENPVKSIKKE